MKYFISRDEQVSGPFSKQQVLAEIKSKTLHKTDLLGTSAKGPWQRVEDAVGTKTPVESEAQNKQGNASAGKIDEFTDLAGDFWDMPDSPAASSLPVAKFYIERNKKIAGPKTITGPYSVKQIEAAIRSGKLREADNFSDSMYGPWMKLRAFYRTNGRIRNELTYVVERQFIARKLRYQCPRCDTTLWSRLSEAGNDDSCPECQTQFSVPSTDALKDYQRTSTDSVIVTPRRQESAEQSKMRKGLYVSGAIFVAFLVIGIPVVWMNGTQFRTNAFGDPAIQGRQAGDDRGAVQKELFENAIQDDRGAVQKELFANAIRAAMDFEPSASSSVKFPLQSELRLIKPGIKSKADQDLYDVLEIVLGIQQERQLLAVVVDNFGTMWTAYAYKLKALAEGVAIQRRNGGSSNLKPSDVKFLDRLYESVKEAAQLSSGGNVVISISSPNTEVETIHALIEESGVADVAKKYSVRTTSSRSGVTFFSARELRTKLKLMESASFETANQMRLK